MRKMYIFVLVNLFVAALGQVHLEGTCSTETALPGGSLDITKMVGTWYEIKRLDVIQELGECSSLTITEQKNAAGAVENYLFTLKGKWNSTTSVEFHGNILAESVAGVYNFNFTEGFSISYIVQSTDYTGHAVIYSCYNASQFKSVNAWQYNRRTSVSDAEQAEIDKVVATSGDLANTTWYNTNRNSEYCNSGVSLSLSSVFYFALVSVVIYVFKDVSY